MSAPLTSADVAAMSGLAPVTIRYHTAMGNIPARKVGAQWLYDRAEVERWIAVPRKRGAPARSAPYKPKGAWTVVTVGPKAKAAHVLGAHRRNLSAPPTAVAVCGWSGTAQAEWKRPTLAEALGASGLPLCGLCAARTDG